jgi:hypothetical protein
MSAQAQGVWFHKRCSGGTAAAASTSNHQQTRYCGLVAPHNNEQLLLNAAAIASNGVRCVEAAAVGWQGISPGLAGVLVIVPWMSICSIL